ncbi:MAG: hypothetical protein MUF64_08330 [Polyangiaceae bacterium]|jgi:hypothetical protein|nr:hypothetical protein [Polyangiaceae bacterium]
MNSYLRHAFCLVLASAAIYTPACSEDHDDGGGHTETPADPSTADVIFPEDGGDEALKVMLAATPTTDAAKAAVLTSPTGGAQLPGTTAPTFTWAVPTTGLRSPRHQTPSRGAGRRFFGPPRSAHAHGDAINGAGYFLVFSAAGNDKLLRVFTTKTSYQPDEAAWAKLKGAQGTLKAELITAVFDNNNLAPGGGPFTSSTSFSIAP